MQLLACVASVSVLFRSKERPRNEILGFGRARNEFHRLLAPFFARSLLRKQHGNACYAGYAVVESIGLQSAFSLKIRLVFISASAIAKHAVICYNKGLGPDEPSSRACVLEFLVQ